MHKPVCPCGNMCTWAQLPKGQKKRIQCPGVRVSYRPLDGVVGN